MKLRYSMGSKHHTFQSRVLNLVRGVHAVSCQIDGDLYLTDEPKEECLQTVQNYFMRGLSWSNIDIRVGYHLTSIYGESRVVVSSLSPFRNRNTLIAFDLNRTLAACSRRP